MITASFATTAVYHKTQQADIYYYQGQALFKEGKFDQAIPYFEKSISFNPRHLGALKELAFSYQWTNRHKEAIACFRDILLLNPKDIRIKSSLATTLAWDRQYSESIALYRELSEESRDYSVRLRLAQVLIWDRQYSQAEQLLKQLIAGKPGDLKPKIYLADAYAYSGDYKKAIAIYKNVLEKEDIRQVRKKLADVLSWDMQYALAIRTYEELIAKGEDAYARLQIARILGWERRYGEAISAYRDLYAKTNKPAFKQEMQSKEAYWDNRVLTAIERYNRLLEMDKSNLEAMFDLAQVYSYQSMWGQAIREYKKILLAAPGHRRAGQSLEKVMIISSRPAYQPGYEFFQADSSSRVDDIKRNSFFNKFSYPVNYSMNFDLGYRLTGRSFSDFGDILENEGSFRFVYRNNPGWWIGAFYDVIVYNKGIDAMNTFGVNHGLRFTDNTVSRFTYQRERLENTSTVIREHFYRDNIKERIDVDVGRRVKLGFDYSFANYSDGNNRHEPGLDILYYFSLDPKRLALSYRYFYKNFLRKVNEYWSPKGYSANSVKLDWRHFLNKDGVFFGVNSLYYDLSYEVTADSTGIVSHKFGAGFNWDINNRLTVSLKGYNTESSANVYKDRNIEASLNYYF